MVKDYLHDLLHLHSTCRSLLRKLQYMMFWAHHSNILLIYWLLVFRKMTFTIHLIFTSLAGIIIWPLSTAIYDLAHEFYLGVSYFYTINIMHIKALDAILTLSQKNPFSHPLQLCVNPFSQSWIFYAGYSIWCFITFSILHMFQHKMLYHFSWHSM